MTTRNEVLLLASTQHGVVSRQQLARLGVSRSQIRGFVTRGELIPAFEGTYIAAGSTRSEHQNRVAAWHSTQPHGVLAGESAGALWEFEGLAPSLPTVVVPRPVVVARTGMTVRSTRSLPAHHVRQVLGVSATSPARTVIDLARSYLPARLSHLVDHALAAGSVTCDQIGAGLAELGTRGRGGSRVLSLLLDERGIGHDLADSLLEQRLAEVVKAAELPEPARQFPLPTDGSRSGLTDACFLDARLIVEIDGRRWHSRHRSMKTDRERDLVAASRGYLTIRLMHEQLTTELEATAHLLAETYWSRIAQTA